MQGRFHWLSTSPERLERVVQDVSYGSEPKLSFYALLAAATLIASFGLIANSTAVIIGAMLVSPLMTPIIGISLALVLGDMNLLRRATQAELLGVLLAVGLALLLGLFPLGLEATSEMLSRTEPNLLDLLVAVFAGFAGTYAMIDERLSPALPGVAIATAIVPPLANCGLCLAMGAYLGAYGSFLLFFANFVAILLVSSGTFIAAGMAPTIKALPKWDLFRRFGIAALSFLAVTVVLTHALVRMVNDRTLNHAIKAGISNELSQIAATSLENTLHQVYEGTLYILATVRTPTVISPERVKSIQEMLGKQLGLPVELIVRCTLAKDISATGSTSQVTAKNLDGFFLARTINPEVLKVQLAEQALRESLSARPELSLLEVDLLNFPRGAVILATVQGTRALIPMEIGALEKSVRDRLQDPQVHLVVRCLTTIDVDREGRVLFGWSHYASPTDEQKVLMTRTNEAVKQEARKFPDLFVTNVDSAPQGDSWAVRMEAVGPRVLTAGDLSRLEKDVSQRVGREVQITVWFKSEVLITSGGYASTEDYTRRRLEEREADPAIQQ